MIEYFEEIDRQIVLAINSWHSPLLDEVMWWISARITWIPLYIFILILAFKKLNKHHFIYFILLAAIAVIVTDLVSVHLFKNVFLRYRPSHNLHLLDQLHFYQIAPGNRYKGGEYGFISSHAANYFAIATASYLVLKKDYSRLKWLLLFIGIIICFSRIYLGVHYLSDVVVGAVIGSLITFLLYKFWYFPLTSSKIK
jgi:undecaprenyl-diphosphatase